MILLFLIGNHICFIERYFGSNLFHFLSYDWKQSFSCDPNAFYFSSIWYFHSKHDDCVDLFTMLF